MNSITNVRQITNKLTIPAKLYPLLTKKQRFIVFLGGRGGAKSRSIIKVLIMLVQTKGEKILCLRQHMNSISDSVHSLIEEEIGIMEVSGFTINKNDITHQNGGCFKFRGLATNIEGLKSYSGFDKFFVEEASVITAKALKIMTPTLRTDNSQIIFALNPDSRLDAMSIRFILPFEKELITNKVYEDDLHYICHVNYTDNPFFPDVLEEERKFDKEFLSIEEYNHIWLGHFLDTVEDSIMKPEWLAKCVDAHKILNFKSSGDKVVGYDPSDSGSDPKGCVLRHGSIVLDAFTDQCKDVNEGLDTALEYSIEKNIDYFVFDSDGLGLSLKRQVNDSLQSEEIDWYPFRGSGSVMDPKDVFENVGSFSKKKAILNKDAILNLRAQMYWRLRNRVYATYLAITKPEYSGTNVDELISFNSNIKELDLLLAELGSIPRKRTTNGKIQILDKGSMKKLKINSPNLADSLMMSLMVRDIPEEDDDTELSFTNPWG